MDKYSIAILKDGVIVGHVLSKVDEFFVKHGGTPICIITGKYRYSDDANIDGLEIPCIMKVNAVPRLQERLNALL